MAWPDGAGALISPDNRKRRRKARRPHSRAIRPFWQPPFVPVARSTRRSRRKTRRTGSRVINPTLMRGRFYHDARGLYRVFNPAEFRFYRSDEVRLPTGDVDVGWGNSALDAFNTDLVALFTMDELSGNLTDVVSSIVATASGGPTYGQPGKVGRAIQFDGADDQFDTAAQASYPAADFTIALWLYLPQYLGILLSFDGGGIEYDLVTASGQTDWREFSPVSQTRASFDGGIGLLGWHHLAITRISDVHAMYLDGVAQTLTISVDDNNSLANTALTIAEHNTVHQEGLFDQAVIWDAGLSAAAVAALWNSGDGRPYIHTALSDLEFDSNPTLPHEPADAYGDGTWFLNADNFNGVIPSGLFPVRATGEQDLRLDLSGGVEINPPPDAPYEFSLEQRAGGVVRINAFYRQSDSNRATQWAITYTTDGSDPLVPPAGGPDITVVMPTAGLAALAYDLAGEVHGTVIKVRVQSRRNDGTWIYSEELTIVTTTADASSTATPLAGERWAGRLPEDF